MTGETQQPEPARRAIHRFRVRQWRRLAILVTLPGVILGTASIAGAFGVGLLSPKPPPTCSPQIVPAPDRGSFRIDLQNANETDGQGRAVAKQLIKRGFNVKSVATAPDGVYVKRSAVIYYGPAGYDQALLLAKQIPGSYLWDDARRGTGVEVVLGYGFTSLVYAPPPPPPLPREITVNVYNTTWRPGLAGSAADTLTARGFRTGSVGNDPNGTFLPDDVAVIRYGEDGADAAQVLRQQLPKARLERDDRTGKKLDLLLGNGFERFRARSVIPAAAAVPTAAPETVARPCTP